MFILVVGAIGVGVWKRCEWFPDLIPGWCKQQNLEKSTQRDTLPDVSNTSLCTGPTANPTLCQQAQQARLQHGIVSDVKANYAYTHYAKTLGQPARRLFI